ncbi:MDR family MFS transporter [Frondihabitans sp. VKM Ac-2883]|uniref:MDR family MFS transporter n=1 Tax=Frondihabitans sp. VKM Ac-2883 TaxID=2783823 RepID=UPI00351C6A20
MWVTAFTIIVGAMAVVFDSTIVSVAINDLSSRLHAPLSTIQWVSTGYLLAMFITIPIAGWAQTALGGKRLWLIALATFLLGSVLCAAAWNAESLIAFRVLQGLGGGIMLPLMTTLIIQAAGGRNIGRVMAAITLPTALGPIIGPVLGGVILAAADWRWLFLVNIPFCVIGGWLAIRNLAPSAPSRRTRLDIIGLLLISPGVIAVVYGLSQAAGAGGFGTGKVLTPFIGGLLLLTGFVGWALRRRDRALIDLRLFAHRPLASGSVLGFLAGATLFGAMFLLPLYWEAARGQTALGAGLLLIPQSIGTLLSRGPAGRLTDKFGPRWVALIGFAIVTLATIPFAFATSDTNYALLLAALLVRGFGMGAAIIPLTGASFIGLAGHEVPGASIITRVIQQIGGSVGTAVAAVVLQTTSTHGASHGYGIAFWFAIGITAVATPVCLVLPGKTAVRRATDEAALATQSV